MKICLIHEEYPEETNFGGIATYQKVLAEELVNLGHKVTIITRGLKKEYEYTENGIRIIRLLKPTTSNILQDYKDYRIKVKNQIEKLVSQNEIELIETPDWGAETIEYFFNRKIPIVVKLHTPLCIWQKYNKTGLKEPLNKNMLKWEKEIIYNADKVISCSNILLDKLKKYYTNLDFSKIEVIPNPANIKVAKPHNNHNMKAILYVGSLEQRKGLDLLAKAIPIFIEKVNRDDIKFLFVGKDTTRNDKNISMIEYIKNIVPPKYHKNLEFIGQIANQDLYTYYGKCMMGIIPSVFDNLPYVAQEMLLNELPIIASNNTGVREMIEDNISGLLFENKNYIDLANKMLTLYYDDNLRKRITNNSRKSIISKHNPQNITKKMVQIYSEVIYDFNNKK